LPALHTLRIIGSGGSNRAMEAEVKRLAPRAIAQRAPKPDRVDTQTLLYPYSPELADFAVDYLRTPSRVMRDLFAAHSARLEPLYDELRAWIGSGRPAFLDGVRTISVRVVEPIDFPASGLQLRGTIKNAIIDGARGHGIDVDLDPERADLTITVRGKTKPLILGIDLAGGSMHERGYRVEQGEAPLKETLAAQMLILSRWDTRTELLVDPLAGAGTIPIEAALMALGAPHERARNKPDLFGDARPEIIANEIHTPLADAMKRNAERAGVAKFVQIRHGDLRDLSIEANRGLLIANPPYGKRLEKGRGGERDVLDVYADLAALHRRLGKDFRAAYIVANDEFEQIYGGKPSMKKPMWNGPIRAWFLTYDRP
jgi:23S rRNA G2445 N2-methylase RlmL